MKTDKSNGDEDLGSRVRNNHGCGAAGTACRAPTVNGKQQQQLPGSKNPNRPLQVQRQLQRRPAEAGRYRVKTLRRLLLFDVGFLFYFWRFQALAYFGFFAGFYFDGLGFGD